MHADVISYFSRAAFFFFLRPEAKKKNSYYTDVKLQCVNICLITRAGVKSSVLSKKKLKLYM